MTANDKPKWSGFMDTEKVKTEMTGLHIEAKIAIVMQLGELINDCKDTDVIKGLKVLFETLICDLVTIKIEQRH
jgi:hypothetical protein